MDRMESESLSINQERREKIRRENEIKDEITANGSLVNSADRSKEIVKQENCFLKCQ